MEKAQARGAKGDRGQIAVLSAAGPVHASAHDSVDSQKAFTTYRDVACGKRKSAMFSNMTSEKPRDELLYRQTDRLENARLEHSRDARLAEVERKNRERLERAKSKTKETTNLRHKFHQTQTNLLNGLKSII